MRRKEWTFNDNQTPPADRGARRAGSATAVGARWGMRGAGAKTIIFWQKHSQTCDFYGSTICPTSLDPNMWVQYERYGGPDVGEKYFQLFFIFIDYRSFSLSLSLLLLYRSISQARHSRLLIGPAPLRARQASVRLSGPGGLPFGPRWSCHPRWTGQLKW